jgi:CDP-glucose 4,6-dehydratase
MGYLLLGSKMYNDPKNYSEAWNFGPSDIGMLTVEEITKKILMEWGVGDYTIEPSVAKVHEATLLKLDCSKAHSLLGWKAIYDVDEAIKKTVAWYKQYYNHSNQSMYEFTIEQIEEYEKALQCRLPKN